MEGRLYLSDQELVLCFDLVVKIALECCRIVFELSFPDHRTIKSVQILYSCQLVLLGSKRLGPLPS